MANNVWVIKEKLARNSLSAKWLINRLAEKGVETDKCEMSNILGGTRKGPKVDRIISESLCILSFYEKTFSQIAQQ